MAVGRPGGRRTRLTGPGGSVSPDLVHGWRSAGVRLGYGGRRWVRIVEATQAAPPWEFLSRSHLGPVGSHTSSESRAGGSREPVA